MLRVALPRLLLGSPSTGSPVSSFRSSIVFGVLSGSDVIPLLTEPWYAGKLLSRDTLIMPPAFSVPE